MKMRKTMAGLLAAVIGFTGLGALPAPALRAQAAVSYPLSYFRLGMSDTDANVNASGTALAPAALNGTSAEKWSLNWVSDGVFEIVSADSGKILTASGSGVSLAADTDAAGQRWKIESVQKDFDGYALYYKIASNADSSKVLTYTEGAGFSLAAYSDKNTYQKYKLNLDGCVGVAANAKVNKGEKACTIGGLLGNTVVATTDKQLIEYLGKTEPLTIVVSGSIDMRSHSHTRIRDNKTLVGAYSNQLTDCMLRTNNEYGTEGDNPSDNIVIRNINFLAKNEKNRILVNIWSSRQIWVDHCTFNSQLSYDRTGNGQDEVGKFIWINTPYESYMDAKDRLRSPDYVTLSYNIFRNRFWTVAYGTQNDEITRDRTSIMYNWWDNDIRRCPQIGNGVMHVVNNYYSSTDSKKCPSTQQIIGGDGSNILSENCRFEGFETMNKMIMTGSKEKYTDNGSYNGTAKLNFSNATKSDLNPGKNNYGYALLDAYNTKNTDTKAFCTKYAGAQGSAAGMKYLTDADVASWAAVTYPCPFLRHVDFSAVSAAVFADGSNWRFKNVNSNLYMQVDGAKAANGTNVQQWGTADGVTHDIWKLHDEGDGWYSLLSAVGDGGTYALDVAGKKTADGTNVDIYQYNGGDNQLFMLTKNADGSYKLRTKITKGASAVEIASAGVGSGDNVQQWAVNGHACQDWILEPVSDPGCKMKTDQLYEFENVNSGMVMDIESGKMADGTNVQQWGTGHFKSQKWVLEAFSGGGNYYYIRSYADQNYVLKINSSDNGGNLAIAPYSSKDSSMLFKFSKAPDGSYWILTRASKDARMVEIGNAAANAGANVQQWDPTGHACQRWNLNAEAIPVPTEPETTEPPTTEPPTTEATEPTEPVTEPTEPAALLGDADANGKIELLDVIKLQRHLLCLDTVKGDADLNQDGEVDVFDLALLKKMLLSVK